MEDAKLTPRRLATRIGVAPRTVERWLTGAELVPHAGNRVDACRALKVNEDVIWPKAVQVRS
ncbi:helix-turn-helix domain-containing protein [Streptomyces spongiicola]|uniref:helix-turn-helix domain-containing protein n=1 Tax=Streptomyces spongiicola TaxID=1690221 RepID=UPI001FE38EE4|nr:helix-turn-helix transcriptional regulator [Streptomyces spongiicola]